MPPPSPTAPTAWSSTSRASTRASTRRPPTSCRACVRKVGPDYPLGLASFPYVDYHPALPYSVFLGPGGAQYNVPQLYWKDIGTTVDSGYIHTWVWNRIYGRQIDPLGQVYSRPKAGQIKRFRALAMSHGFDGVSWWDWQEAGKRQWKAVGQPISPASTGPVSELSVPPSGLEGRLRGLGPAAARGRRLQRAGERLLPGLDPGRGPRLPARPWAGADRQPRRADLGPADAEQAAPGPLGERRRRRAREGVGSPCAARRRSRRSCRRSGTRFRRPPSAASRSSLHVGSAAPGAAAEGQQPDLAVPDRDGRPDRRLRPGLHLAAQLPDQPAAQRGGVRSHRPELARVRGDSVPDHPSEHRRLRHRRGGRVRPRPVPGRGRLPGDQGLRRGGRSQPGQPGRRAWGRSRSTRSRGGRRCSRRCSCTAAGCTSSATCSSSGSSATTSRTEWDASGSCSSTSWPG